MDIDLPLFGRVFFVLYALTRRAELHAKALEKSAHSDEQLKGNCNWLLSLLYDIDRDLNALEFASSEFLTSRLTIKSCIELLNIRIGQQTQNEMTAWNSEDVDPDFPETYPKADYSELVAALDDLWHLHGTNLALASELLKLGHSDPPDETPEWSKPIYKGSLCKIIGGYEKFESVLDFGKRHAIPIVSVSRHKAKVDLNRLTCEQRELLELERQNELNREKVRNQSKKRRKADRELTTN